MSRLSDRARLHRLGELGINQGRWAPITLTIITGPPASGKTTWAKDHAKPGDITIDYDHIANTLSGQPRDNHTHTGTVKRVTQAARNAAITAALTEARHTDVWIIHSQPSKSAIERYKRHGATFKQIDPGAHTVLDRCKAERPPESLEAAERWYEAQAGPKPAHERGYDHRHKTNRRRLLHHLKDGTPCAWCHRPLYKRPERNFDGAPLEADHSKDLKHHGPSDADRLLHRTCNRQRGAGHDERKPTQANKAFTWV